MGIWNRVMRCFRENGLKYTFVKACLTLGGIFEKLILVDYYEDMRNRLAHYEKIYGEASRKTALRMLWWNFKQLFKIHVKDRPCAPQANRIAPSEEKKTLRKQLGLQDDQLHIAFRLNGGMGDYLIFANYLLHFREKFSASCICVDLYFVKGFGYSQLLFQDSELCRNCCMCSDFDIRLDAYDICFYLDRYPSVRYYDAMKVMNFAPELLEYCLLCERFEEENRRFFDCLPECDGQEAMFSVLCGQTRLQQPDIYGYFQIGREFVYQPNIKKDEILTLTAFGLKSKKFVTLYYGCELAYTTSVKMWPHRYYSELAAKIKKEFPNLTIVQYGVNRKISPPIQNIDVDLVGKTDMEDVSILLKHSLVHVDCEGGMIHLRNALHGGRSVGLYGPTQERFYGYDGDIRLRGDGCPESCEWLTGNWMVACSAGFSEPPCMASITPETAMNAVRAILREEHGHEAGNIFESV